MNPFCRKTLAVAMPTMRWRAPRWPLFAQGGMARRHSMSRSLRGVALATGISLFTPTVLALDVNVASAEQLEGLRGLGPRTAQIIVRERERGGKFESLEDLSDRVRGIGLKKAQALQAAGMTVGGMTSLPGATSPKAGGTPLAPTAPKATAKPSSNPMSKPSSGATTAPSASRSSAGTPSGRGVVPGRTGP